MLLKFFSLLIFIGILIPISAIRKVTKSSRFGLIFHQSPSSWEQYPLKGVYKED